MDKSPHPGRRRTPVRTPPVDALPQHGKLCRGQSGDAAFRQACEAALADRLSRRGAVIVSHSLGFLRRVCDAGVVIEDGRAAWFDSIETAIAAHQATMASPA